MGRFRRWLCPLLLLAHLGADPVPAQFGEGRTAGISGGLRVGRLSAATEVKDERNRQIRAFMRRGLYGRWQAELEFGYGRPEVTVSQHWERDHPVRVQGTEAVTLVLSKPGRALVVVADYADGADPATMIIDRQRLGLGEKLTATDMETEEKLGVTDDGRIAFTLRRHDFRLVLVEAQ